MEFEINDPEWHPATAESHVVDKDGARPSRDTFAAYYEGSN
jgi:hypothetical protein